ncbi:MAG: hypothetical protein QOE61_4785, partial [Micromonosporaceae bacterium]|nr:hypothetical protein [Micromonosporaceae bacterium]
DELSAWAGGVEHCSPAVAVDMMLSLQTGGAGGQAYGEANAAWRAGGARSRALRPAQDTNAPMFPGQVAVQPFLSTETRRLAVALGLSTVDWFNVYPGPNVRALLATLPAAARAGADRDALTVRMIRAAEVDLAGRSPYYQLVFAVRGVRDGVAAGVTAVLRTASSYRLTGLVGSLATVAVLDGHLPTGVHYAADVLDPAAVVTAVRRSGELTLLSVTADGDTDEEGSL